MKSASHPLTNLFFFLIIGGFLVSNASCGLHFGYGTKSSGKGQKVSSLVSDEGSALLDEPLVHPVSQNTMNPGYLDGGEKGEALKDHKSALGGDPFAQGWPPGVTAEDYWAQRDQAEFLTEQAGLRDIFFEFDSWNLTNEAKRILTSNAEWLKAHPEAQITIEGHCDERGTRAYNYVLGEKRATRTRNYLASLGVSPSQLIVMSYGKDNPFCKQATNRCFQDNRRAHMVLGTAVASSSQKDTAALKVYE